ncbi:protein kinase [Nocardia sp. NPDC020380]|uniref:serine/threonine-protein kinase n=1 Tax=Nocardia sp. NPDC020380 TaxID=3364309 RepID=UPI00379BE394
MISGRHVVDGRFELLGPLGSGGMGTVWRAYDLALHREVALKEVRPPEGDAAAEVTGLQRERVLREARALARIGHPNVVAIHHIVDAPGAPPWIVMELVRGGSLADLLAEGPLPPAQAAHLGRGILAALRAAHAVGVLHRDIKPANVLLRQDGSPVLTDFGIAAIEGMSGLTSTGSVVGSLDYVAPERLSGQEGHPASDLWALGLVLYVAVEGHHPLRRDTSVATLAAVLKGEVQPPQHAGPLTAALQAVLVADPDRRPDTDQLDRMLAEATGLSAAGLPPLSPAVYTAPAPPGSAPRPPQPYATTQDSHPSSGPPQPDSATYQPGNTSPSYPPHGPTQPSMPQPRSDVPSPGFAYGPAAYDAPPSPLRYGPADGDSGPRQDGFTPGSQSGAAQSWPHEVQRAGLGHGQPHGPGGQPHGPGGAVPAFVPRGRNGSRGRNGILVALGALLVVGVVVVIAVVMLPKSTGQQNVSVKTPPGVTVPGLAPGVPAPAPTTTADAQTVDLLTPDGMRQVVAALEKASGGKDFTQTVVYPTYASAGVLLADGSKRYDSYYYRDGTASRQGPGGTLTGDDKSVQLDSINWHVLPALLSAANDKLGVPNPTSRYVIVDPGWTFNDGKPTIMVYLSDDYGGSAYLAADVDGTIVKVYPREK